MMDRGQPLVVLSICDYTAAIDTLGEIIKLKLSDEGIIELVLQRYIDSLICLLNSLEKIQSGEDNGR